MCSLPRLPLDHEDGKQETQNSSRAFKPSKSLVSKALPSVEVNYDFAAKTLPSLDKSDNIFEKL